MDQVNELKVENAGLRSNHDAMAKKMFSMEQARLEERVQHAGLKARHLELLEKIKQQRNPDSILL